MRMSLKLYRLLLKIYPAGFRDDYGGPLQQQFKDDYRDLRGGRDRLRFWAETIADILRTAPGQLAREMAQDAAHALRVWRRRPLNTAFAIAVLAIAIGANAGVFSVMNALLLRALPFHQSDRLAQLQMFSPPRPEFHDWRRNSAYLADAAMYLSHEVNVEGSQRHARRLRLTETSSNFFSLVGREPVLGRAFAHGEDVPGRNLLAVIGYGLWLDLYAGRPDAVGSRIVVNGAPLTIVGVAPPGFDYPQRTDLWSPTTFDLPAIPKSGVGFWMTIGRLRDGIPWTEARQAFETEAYQRAPDRRGMDAANRPSLIPLRDQLSAQIRTASAILMGGVALLLLLACANVANLLLARAIGRSSEMKIRTALGASRARLTQQMLTETILLSAIATAFGLFVAHWITGLAARVQPAQLSSQDYTILDWRVLAFTIVLAVITGIAFGVGPALCANRGDFSTGRTTPAARRSRTRSALVATQVAVTIVLLTGSIALGRAFVTLLRTDNGFDVRSLATMTVSLTGAGYDSDAVRSYMDDVMTRVRAIPGVLSVSGTESLPLQVVGHMAGRFNIDNTGPTPLTIASYIAPGFFSSMGARILAGREFDARDYAQPDAFVVVNEQFARQFAENDDILNRFVTGGRFKPRQIIGVVRGMRDGGPAYSAEPQVFYLSRSPRDLTIVARVAGPPRDRIGVIRDAVQSVDRRVPVFNVRTMEERLDAVLSRAKFYTTALIFFGGLAMLLAVIGLYGIVSYGVQQRTREMGIRLALGTTAGRLRLAIMRQTFVTIATGAAAGVVLAMAAGRYLQSLVHGAESSANTVAFGVLVLAVTSACAVWSATRHIARLDIADVLRVDSTE